MRTRLLVSVATLSVLSVPAFAADLGNYEAPPAPAYSAPASVSNWTGPELGVLLGYSFGHSDMRPNGRSKIKNDEVSGIDGGIYGGYNYQFSNNVVVGAEADVVASGAEGRDSGFKGQQDWEGTVRGKVGYALNQFLLYGTGGVALGNLKVSHDGESDKHTAWGWTAGAGGETKLTDHITARVEYRYTDYDSNGFDVRPHTKADLTNNSIRAGLGYKF